MPTLRSSRDSARHPSPPLGLLATVFTGLFLGSLAAGAILTGGAPFPIPFGATPESLRYFVEHSAAVRVAAFFQFAAAIPLGLFTAVVVSRLRFLGIEAAGVTIAQFGGFAASFFLAASALIGWVLAAPQVADVTSNARVLLLLAFATGGPGHVVPLGLLLAGVSVSGGLTRNIPRWLMWYGIVLAVLAELSTLTLLSERAALLLPLARFPAFIWILSVGFTLASRRPGIPGTVARGFEEQASGVERR
jgi:hypothetical protein